MKLAYILIGLSFVLVSVVFAVIKLLENTNKSSQTRKVDIAPNITEQNITEDNKMKISSSAFVNNQLIPAKYTCDGDPPAGGVNPPLSISDVPDNAKSLVLIMDDPDAPAGTWVHWTVWNMDPKTMEIAENSVPQGATEGNTSFGKPGYGGPCPPSGTHRYFFKLYTLDTTLSLTSNSTKEDLEKAMEGHILEKAELIGLYSKK